MVGPKTSLFIQVVAAASVGGAIGFYIQHRVWSVEKVTRTLNSKIKQYMDYGIGNMDNNMADWP